MNTQSPLSSQVSLYLLLMEERYGQEVNLGLLWNINNSDMQAVRKVCIPRPRQWIHTILKIWIEIKGAGIHDFLHMSIHVACRVWLS